TAADLDNWSALLTGPRLRTWAGTLVSITTKPESRHAAIAGPQSTRRYRREVRLFIWTPFKVSARDALCCIEYAYPRCASTGIFNCWGGIGPCLASRGRGLSSRRPEDGQEPATEQLCTRARLSKLCGLSTFDRLLRRPEHPGLTLRCAHQHKARASNGL